MKERILSPCLTVFELYLSLLLPSESDSDSDWNHPLALLGFQFTDGRCLSIYSPCEPIPYCVCLCVYVHACVCVSAWRYRCG